MNHKLLLILSLTLLSLNAWGQSTITMKGDWMFTDVTLSDGGSTHKVPGLIDTGCSVCIMDSTYAVDSCHIKDLRGDKMMDNTAGQSIQWVAQVVQYICTHCFIKQTFVVPQFLVIR